MSDDILEPVNTHVRGTGLPGFGHVPDHASKNPWADVWAANRGIFKFRLKPLETATVIFLSEPVIIPAFDLCTKWDNWAQFEQVRTRAWDFDPRSGLVQTGKVDPFSVAFKNRDPRVIYVFKILDTRPYKGTAKVWDPATRERTEKPVNRPWTVSLLVLRNMSAMAGLDAAAASHLVNPKTGQPRFSGVRMNIMRSADKKSAASGEHFQVLKQLDLATVYSAKPEIETLANQIDIQKCYPLISDETAIGMLRMHKRIMDEHKSHARDPYDPQGMAAVLNGTWKQHGDTRSVDDDLSPADSIGDDLGLSKLRTQGSSLDDLDDILDDGAAAEAAPSAEDDLSALSLYDDDETADR